MKQTLLLAVLASIVLAGCVSQHKLTQPSGRWQAINQEGFVPADADRFYKAVVEQAVAEVAAEFAEPVSEFGQTDALESNQPTDVQ
ncbi:hypothetical protein B0181_11105 [Moraxella caviae]|uniref:Lipoprotein n=1 Tax=Moraxella caviae TaxID=34060 RepID=A0A1S9ZUD7_9GAMM|nr:hypothetical protein [Moraxella caviae]OOR87115.1 hypothetical protein B0181_11105 [Moraxella caviae]STZ13647.1 Uncharacterised protein [Moraxella caviae]